MAATATVKAMAYVFGWMDSGVASAAYTITGTVATPMFGVPAGTYTTAQAVSLNTTTAGATIRYTTDGTTPTEAAGTVYTAPVTVSATAALKAVAYLAGWNTSGVASAQYTITGTVATPAFSVPAGTYTTVQTVALTTATLGATIRYTTDGSAPTPTTGTEYAGPIAVSATTTIRAIAYLAGWNDSAMASASYALNLPPADFTMTLGTGPSPWLAGMSGTFTFTLAASSTFNDTVTLTGAQLPGGATISFAPASVALGASGTATVTATVATKQTEYGGVAGYFNPIVTASATSAAHSLTVPMTLQDFGVKFAKQKEYVACTGGQLTMEFTVQSVNGLDTSGVALAFPGFYTSDSTGPDYAGGAIGSGATIGQNGDVQGVFVNVWPISCSGYERRWAKLRGTIGGVTHYSVMEVDINTQQPADFTVNVSPPSQTLMQPGTVGYPITINSGWAYTGQVSVSVSGVPAGATWEVDRADGTPQTSYWVSGGYPPRMTLKVTTTAGTAAGTWPLTVTVSDGSITRTASAGLTVGGSTISTYSISASESSIPITIDGQEYSSSAAMPWQSGTGHTILAPSEHNDPSGRRFVFVQWADGVTTNQRSAFADGVNVSYRADYVCAGIDCVFGLTTIHYDPPAFIYAESKSWSNVTRYFVQNVVSATTSVFQAGTNGTPLGSDCSSASSKWGTDVAVSRSPCHLDNIPDRSYYVSAYGADAHRTNTYQVEGSHSFYQDGVKLIASLKTYDSLSFAAAGGIAHLDVQLDSSSDYTKAAPPVIDPAGDGVSAKYTALNSSSISLDLTLPYTAKKGLHRISFPTTNKIGNNVSNPFLAVIVFDGTPHINSVTPSSIPAGTTTQITITGYWFGDHPTVCIGGTGAGCVGGTKYNATTSQINNGVNDQVIVTVSALPTYSSPNVPVSIVSNGAGGQAFFGAPLGQAAGSPLSNTVNVGITYAITGRITIETGAGLAGLAGITITDTVTTDADGYYTVNVAAGQPYTVTPKDLVSNKYWFDPPSTRFDSITSAQTANFSANTVTWIYLLHGINQPSGAMDNLALHLQTALDGNKYKIDSGFSFACAWYCSSDCAPIPGGSTLIDVGARRLADYIQALEPPGRIILIGYSMGGLIARDLIAHDYNGVLSRHPVSALITLGTPNLGYPYSGVYWSAEKVGGVFNPLIPAACPQLLYDMSGSWRLDQSYWTQVSSPYLDALRQQWALRAYGGYWMAAAGESCTQMPHTVRQSKLAGEPVLGCPDVSAPPAEVSPGTADGVVCKWSALYPASPAGGPASDVPWFDLERTYVHTNAFAGWASGAILCSNSGDASINPQLFDPPIERTLFSTIKDVINAH